MVNSLIATNAYNNQMKLQSGISDATGQEETANSSFSSLLKDSLNNAIDTQYKTEHVKMDALVGNVDITDLVTAISSAELSLNTVVAIRDKVIGAYQDIIRMPM